MVLGQRVCSNQPGDSASACVQGLQWELCLQMDLNLQIFKLAKETGLDLAPNTACDSNKEAEEGHACLFVLLLHMFFWLVFQLQSLWCDIRLDFIWCPSPLH